jgi:membrane protein implicated in regulation of membrane protease activity
VYDDGSVSVWRRYLLFQIPGWALAAILLGALRSWLDLPLWAALLIFAAYVAKDFALYPFLRHSYRQDPRTQLERLIGERAVAAETLNPAGFIRLRGELWKAAVRPGSAAIERGAEVEIEGAEKWTLIVAPAAPLNTESPDSGRPPDPPTGRSE